MPSKILVFVFSNFLTIYAEESIHDEEMPLLFPPIFSLPFLSIRSSNIHNFCPSCFYMIHIYFFANFEINQEEKFCNNKYIFSFKTFQIFLASTFFLTSIKTFVMQTVSLHICCKFYPHKNLKTISKNTFYAGNTAN